jgi:hypothetical protein
LTPARTLRGAGELVGFVEHSGHVQGIPGRGGGGVVGGGPGGAVAVPVVAVGVLHTGAGCGVGEAVEGVVGVGAFVGGPGSYGDVVINPK